jgi:uncharacterized protein (DUF4415 family)
MIFLTLFISQRLTGKVHMKDKQSEPLQTEFDATAAPDPTRVTVTLDMDADLLAWLKAQPTDWQREINNTMRFFMETSAAPAKPRKRYDPEAGYSPS